MRWRGIRVVVDGTNEAAWGGGGGGGGGDIGGGRRGDDRGSGGVHTLHGSVIGVHRSA